MYFSKEGLHGYENITFTLLINNKEMAETSSQD